ncbi:30S ribosomal protein S20 [Alphaproteobacteria bacterium]|nr:30S ribosomal protein S20 [Alphaproteobacteria bacterium]GHS95779.1 30S ribosomal protein S20 [Alphaproteobacteria bacterium]
MPSHKSVEKVVRQIKRRTLVNKARISRIRTFVKKVEDELRSFGKNAEITEATIKASLVSAEKELMRGTSRGVLHKNTAARKVSRLHRKAKKILGN